MYIKKLEIENFKGINHIELLLKPGVNLLIGDNGVGKTSILDAIVVALGGFLSGIAGVTAKNVLLSDIKIDTHNLGSVSTGIAYKTPVKISCAMEVEDENMEWCRYRADESGSTKTKTIKLKGDIVKYAKNITNDMTRDLPILSYQSSLRAAQSKRGDFGAAMKQKMNDRRCGYLGCLDTILDIKGIKAWCYEMERAAFDRGRKIEEYEQFKHIVTMVMSNMSDLDRLPEIFYSRQHEDMVYSEGDNIMPISCLSAGYQSVLWMVMDIAYRLATLNPGKIDLMNSEGIVLIDEIDMHLHPKWQWNVLNTLEETFPNIQFIVATHSPIIISSCKNENLILIDNEQKVNYLKDAYAYSVKDVLELRQGSFEIPKEIRILSEQFDKAMNEENYEIAKCILNEMKEKYGSENTEVKKALAEYELEIEMAKDDWGV